MNPLHSLIPVKRIRTDNRFLSEKVSSKGFPKRSAGKWSNEEGRGKQVRKEKSVGA